MKPEKAHGPQILLVDDNPTNLQVLYQTLDGNGYRLLAARSGKDAISIAERAVPDLILLDVMMPEMDGFETCARLKARSAHPRCRGHLSLGADRAERQGARSRARRGGFRQQAVPGGGSARQSQDAPDDSRSPEAASQAQRGAGARADRGSGAASRGERPHRRRPARRQRRGRAPSAGHCRKRRSPTRRCSSAGRPAATTKRSPAPCIISRRARPAPSSASIVSRRLPDASPSSGETGGSRTSSTSGAWPTAARCTWKASSICRTESQRMLAERLRALGGGASRSGGSAEPDVRVIVSTTRDVDEELAAGRLIPELHRALPTHARSRAAAREAGRPAGARPSHPPAPGRTGRADRSDHLGRVAEAVEELPVARQSSRAAERARSRRWPPARARCWRSAITCWTTACASEATA